MYEVVHCTTQEELDFAISKCKSKSSYLFLNGLNLKKALRNYPEGICINTEENYYGGLNWYKERNSKIYSFQEWCKKFKYKHEIQNNSEFKVGDWVVFEVDKCVGELKDNKTSAWDRYMVLQIERFNGYTINPTLESLKRYKHYDWNKAENNIKCFRKAKLEEIPVKDLSNTEVKDDFVLPEKWYVVVTKENKDLVSKWKFNSEIPIRFQEGCIAGFCKNSKTKEWDLKVTSNWINEITTEQFRKYVLGEKIENNSVFPTELIDKRIEELENSEIYIPIITKPKKKIDYTINSVFADIKVNLPEKPKKVVKPIVLEKFNLII